MHHNSKKSTLTPRGFRRFLRCPLARNRANLNQCSFARDCGMAVNAHEKRTGGCEDPLPFRNQGSSVGLRFGGTNCWKPTLVCRPDPRRVRFQPTGGGLANHVPTNAHQNLAFFACRGLSFAVREVLARNLLILTRVSKVKAISLGRSVKILPPKPDMTSASRKGIRRFDSAVASHTM